MSSKHVLLIIFHTLCFQGFLGAFALAWLTIIMRRNTSANAWLLPFAYLSLISWVVWAFQYLTLLDGLYTSFLGGSFRTFGLYLGVILNAVWIVAISSLYTNQFSKVSLTLPFLVIISLVIVLVSYQTNIFAYGLFTQFDAISAATIFFVLAGSIIKLGLNRLAAVVFFIHGCSQWKWRNLLIAPSDDGQIMTILFPLWHIALLFIWMAVISEMLITLRVMLSSTVKDLGPEREAAARAIRNLNLEGFRAEAIEPLPYTPKSICALWAEQCHIFILIIGERYGHEITIKSKKISAVEFEYAIAAKQNRQKILVYVKDGVTREPQLEKFLERLEDFKKGHILKRFTSLDELYRKIQDGIQNWRSLPRTLK